MPRARAKTPARSQRHWRRRDCFWFESRFRVRSRSGCARVSRATSWTFGPTIFDNSTRRFFFLHNANEFVVAQPERLPNKIILGGNADCFFAGKIEFFDRRLRTIPVFALVLGA